VLKSNISFAFSSPSQQSMADTARWDVFRNLPPTNNSLSENSDKYMAVTVKFLKVSHLFQNYKMITSRSLISTILIYIEKMLTISYMIW